MFFFGSYTSDIYFDQLKILIKHQTLCENLGF